MGSGGMSLLTAVRGVQHGAAPSTQSSHWCASDDGTGISSLKGLSGTQAMQEKLPFPTGIHPFGAV